MSLVVTFFIYVFVGFFGYLSFLSLTNEDILGKKKRNEKETNMNEWKIKQTEIEKKKLNNS